jgi:uncharacterized protein YecE (DUF72 family)
VNVCITAADITAAEDTREQVTAAYSDAGLNEWAAKVAPGRHGRDVFVYTATK